MTTPDTPTLLANASAGQLLDDAKWAEGMAALDIGTRIIVNGPDSPDRASLLRLAELARAVVALEERPTLVHYEDGDWDEDHHHPGYWRTRIRGTMGYSRHSTLCAALAATRHTQGEG